VNIRLVARTSDIRNFSQNIRSDVETSEVATLLVTEIQHGSRSREFKRWRHKSIWREWLLLSSWFWLRNREENVRRLLR